MPVLRQDDFSDGLWLVGESAPTNEQAGFGVPLGALLKADNLDYLKNGAIRGRRGSRKDNPTAQRSGSILALRRFYHQTESGSKSNILDGIAFDDAGVGSVTWLVPEGAQFPNDGNEARANLVGGTQSHYLVRRGGYHVDPIPTAGTITGVRVSVAYYQALYTFPFETARVRLFDNGIEIGGAPSNENPGIPYAADEEWHTLLFGSDSDTWGLGGTLTPALVNSEQFGAAFSIQQPVGGGANSLFVGFIGIWVYYSAAEESEFVVGSVSGGALVYETLSGGTFSGIPGGGTLDNPNRRPWSVHWPEKRKVFFFDGLNAPRQYDGASMSVIPTADAIGVEPPYGPYVALHQARMFATTPAELSYSVYATLINNETAWPSHLHLNVNDANGGLITGLASWQDRLIILKNTALFRFMGDIEFGPELILYEPVHGCIAPDTIAVAPWGVIYLARDGLRLTDGLTSILLSDAIAPLFIERNTQTLYANAVGRYFPRRDQYWLKLDPTDAEGYVLHRFTYPTEEGEAVKHVWSRIPSLPMNVAEVWQGGADDGELYMGDTNGWVWERDTGTQDDGNNYSVELVTLQRQLDARQRKRGRVNQLQPLYRSDASMTVGIRYDQASADDVSVTVGSALGQPEFQEPRVFVADMANFGRFVSFHVLGSGGPEFELHRVEAELRLRSNRRWP